MDRLMTWTIGIMASLGYLFLLAPMFIIVPMSLGQTNELEFPPRELSIELYRAFFSDPSWWGSAVQSVRVATATTALALFLGVPSAYVIARGPRYLRKILSILFMAPILVPVVVVGLGMYLQLSRLGLVETTIGLIFAHTVMATPYVIISITAGLRHLDASLETAASIMGASDAKVFFSIVLPQIVPSIVVAGLFAFLISFDEVVVAYFVTGPTTMTLPVKMYSAIRWEISPVIAAVGTGLTLVSSFGCILALWLQPKEPKALTANG